MDLKAGNIAATVPVNKDTSMHAAVRSRDSIIDGSKNGLLNVAFIVSVKKYRNTPPQIGRAHV